MNLNGTSAIRRYLSGNNYIIIKTEPSRADAPIFYKYSIAAAGERAVLTMQELAAQGRGLDVFIRTIHAAPERTGRELANVL